MIIFDFSDIERRTAIIISQILLGFKGSLLFLGPLLFLFSKKTRRFLANDNYNEDHLHELVPGLFLITVIGFVFLKYPILRLFFILCKEEFIAHYFSCL